MISLLFSLKFILKKSFSENSLFFELFWKISKDYYYLIQEVDFRWFCHFILLPNGHLIFIKVTVSLSQSVLAKLKRPPKKDFFVSVYTLNST